MSHEGRPQGAPLPIANRSRLKDRSPEGLYSAVKRPNRHSLLKRVNKGSLKAACGDRRRCQHTGARTRDVRALHERLREIGQKNFRGRTAVERWSKVRTGTVFGVITKGLPEGRLRGSKRLQLMSARTRDVRALHERLREIGQKNFRGRTAVERWSKVRTGTVFGVVTKGLPEGRLRGRRGCQHTNARTRDVRALHERLREIRQKNFRGATGVDRWSIVRAGRAFGGRYAGPP